MIKNTQENKSPSDIKKRMVEKILNSKITMNKFYKTTKVSNGSLTKSGNITINTLIKFLDFFPDTDLNWLIRGVKKESNRYDLNSDSHTSEVEEGKTEYKLATKILKEQLDIKDNQISELLKIINKLK